MANTPNTDFSNYYTSSPTLSPTLGQATGANQAVTKELEQWGDDPSKTPLNTNGYAATPQGAYTDQIGTGPNATPLAPSQSAAGGNQMAENAVQLSAPAYAAQIQNAMGTGAEEMGLGNWAMQQKAPTIGTASTQNLQQGLSGVMQGQGDIGAANQGYQEVAEGKGPMGQLAENQLNSSIGQSLASNLALAHSASGPLGQASAMRTAQQQNANTTASAANQSAQLAATEQQAGLAGMASTGAASGQLGQAYGQLGLGEYQTAQQALGQQATLTQQQQNQNEQFMNQMLSQNQNEQSFAGNQLNSQVGQQVNVGEGLAGNSVAQQNANNNTLTAVAPYGQMALTGIGAMMMSDERVKHDTGDAPDLTDQFLRMLDPKHFKYDSPQYEPIPNPRGGEYLGVMAQDLERTPGIGRQLVSENKQGVKQINTGSALEALLAGVGRLDERMRALEKMKGAAHGG